MKETTADRLNQIMKERNLKQVDLLRLCQPYCETYDVRIGRNDINQYVHGKTKPRQDKLTILGLALNVSEAWLMGYDVPRERSETQGDKLRRYRREHNLTLSELAHDLHISVDDMQDYENDRKAIPTWVVRSIGNYFGIEKTTEYHTNRYRKMIDALEGTILTDDEFDKVLDYVKFIVSQRGNNK